MAPPAVVVPSFCIRGFRVTQVEINSRTLIGYIEPQPHRVCCPACRSRDVICRGAGTRTLRNLPIGSDFSWLIATVWRVHCRAYVVVRQISQSLAAPRRFDTHVFARYVLERLRYMTIQDVARRLGVRWDNIRDIRKRHSKRPYARPNPKGLRPHEGTNDQIKTLNRQHYGLRDREFFTLKLYQLHEAKYALVGCAEKCG